MLGKWIDQINQKIDTAVDFFVDEEEIEDDDEVNPEVVGEHRTDDNTNGTASSQLDIIASVSPSFFLSSSLVESEGNNIVTSGATVVSNVGKHSVCVEGLDSIDASEDACFQKHSINRRGSHFLSPVVVHNTTHADMVNNQDSALESLVRAGVTTSPSPSQHSDMNESSSTFQEEADGRDAHIENNVSSTPSVNALLPEKKFSPSDVVSEMLTTLPEKSVQPSHLVEPISSFLHSQERSPELVKLNTASQEVECSTCKEEMQPTLYEHLSTEMANPVAHTEEIYTLKGHLKQAQTEFSLKGNASSQASTKDEVSVAEELEREKRRNKQFAEDRKMLLGKISDLEAIVKDYQEKEESWSRIQKTQQEAFNSLTHKKSKLEEELKHRKTCIVELSKKLSKAQQSDTSFNTRLQSIVSEHTNAVNELNRHHLDAQNRLENEIKDLKEAIHRFRLEFDEQVCESERKISEANQRAHFAEMRLTEAELRSANFLYDLKTELEDTQKRITLLSSELDEARNERGEILARYNRLKREHVVEEDSHREHQERQAAALSEAHREIQLLKGQVSIFQEKSLAAQHEVEDLKRRCIMLEAGNVETTAPENGDVHREMVIDPEHDSLSKTANSVADETFSQLSSFNLVATQRQSDSVPRPKVLYPPLPLEPNILFSSVHKDDTTAKSRDRLEKEVIRQAAEIGRLKGNEMEVASMRRKLTELNKKYDLLLQMYGQLEEEYNTQKELISKSVAGEHPSERVT
ncbi:unnamed protein product [Phytomonas sp. EM1]|nr:unnamed protein product [Phytomonas sp. EM1]|eukprot:CCW61898.1 unnamed protein product [Phytomonas sp. isolate EM1]